MTMAAFERAWNLLKVLHEGPTTVYWNYGGEAHSWKDHLDWEVGDKGNFGGDPQDPFWRKMEQKYSLNPDSQVIWVTPSPDVARTYGTPWAEDLWIDDNEGRTVIDETDTEAHERYGTDLKWRNVEDTWPRGFPMVVDIPEDELSRFDDRDGMPMSEIDDGDDGVLYLLRGDDL